MLDHVSLGVVGLARAGDFYDAVLATLGYVRLHANARGIQYGIAGSLDEPPFAILAANEVAATRCFHLALRAPSPASVDAFHAAALSRGGVDDGPPGPRDAYGPGYYAAFVVDLDGHRLEAVCHAAR